MIPVLSDSQSRGSWTLGGAGPKHACVGGGGRAQGPGGLRAELAPVVPEGVGGGLLDAHEGLRVQDAVVHVDGVATVLPLGLCLCGHGDTR